jgi:hypothetical protein
MKQLSLIIIATFCGSLSIFAQLQETRMVGMLAFGTNTFADSVAARNIYAAVTRILVQTKRFTVLEMDKWQLTQDEIERQRSAGFLESEVIQKGKSLGAQVLIVGFVKNAEVYHNGNSYSARVDYELKYIDVETGKTLNAAAFTGDSENFHTKAGKIGKDLGKTAASLLYSSTRNYKTAAVAGSVWNQLYMNDDNERQMVQGKTIDAIEESAGRVNAWVHRTFDLTLYLLQTDDNGRSVLIQGGEDVGMKKGLKLKVVLVTDMQTPAGPVRDEEPVADLEVEEVRPATSKCKVIKGNKKLQEAAKDKNMRIVFN